MSERPRYPMKTFRVTGASMAVARGRGHFTGIAPSGGRSSTILMLLAGTVRGGLTQSNDRRKETE
ncbi:hypothetical protein HKCCSP123_04630 [Rhodobacterales bacterium HKCCSP123]|nr:hypothetical protein [Rhodobacterales bacterium HKCCSP123]